MKLEGISKIPFEVNVNSVKVEGVCKFKDKVTDEKVNCEGIVKFKDDIDCKILEAEGLLRINGNIRAYEKIGIDGVLKMHSNISAESLKFEGVPIIYGKIEADEVRFYFMEYGFGSEIFGSFIKIRRKAEIKESPVKINNNIINRIYLGNAKIHHDKFSVNLMEADEISIEHTICNMLRGGKVYVGEGCEIENLEYSESLEIHPDANVKNAVKI